MSKELDRSLNQRHFPSIEGSRLSRGQICCCVGGHQKQKLIDTMLQANQSLAKQAQQLEAEKKELRETIIERDRTIRNRDQDVEASRREKARLLATIDQLRAELANWS